MFNFSIFALVGVNLLPLFGVIFFGWNASEIILVYWFENVVIGTYNVLKMAMAQKPATSTIYVMGEPKTATTSALILFFIVHFGVFTLAHGIFVFMLFINDLQLGIWLFVAMVSLFVSHGISFLLNYVGKQEYKLLSPDSLMTAPYSRVIIMHTTIVFTGILATVGGGFISLLLLIGLKTVADLVGHLFEHTKNNTYVLKPWGEKLLRFMIPHWDIKMERIFEESVASGTFDQISTQMDPETVKYIKKYFATPRDKRSQLTPPTSFQKPSSTTVEVNDY